MGQAQRSSTRGNSSKNNISVISGGNSHSRTGGRVRAGQRRTDHDGLENLELWELSREEDDSRMMRLADRDQTRSRQRPSRTISYSDNRNTGNSRPVSSIKRRRAKRRQRNLYRLFAFLIIGVCLVLIYQTTGAIYRMVHNEKTGKGRGIVEIMSEKIEGKRIEPPEMITDYLDPNEFSRPGTKLGKVKNVFVHYTANPGTSAAQNRSYFANLAQTQERSASAHFIIGYEGELIQCIPLEEQAYAVATRNGDSVSIECCYLDEDGKFTQETYDTLVHTLAWLCGEYRLSPDDILRHYDCGGKKCPLYYVEHEDAWERLLADVEAYRESL
ncbi:MAG: peptidoglycan recognition family protein [Lachnospiraceae bacterium]|nr:peptidoglycan recognition family protein [Lachnospiraceae bacterium]